MNGGSNAVADCPAILHDDPLLGPHGWEGRSKAKLAEIVPFPGSRDPHEGWHGEQLVLSAELAPPPWRFGRSHTRRRTRSTRVGVDVLGDNPDAAIGFRALTPQDLLEELRQRTELAQLRAEIERLRANIAALRGAHRRLLAKKRVQANTVRQRGAGQPFELHGFRLAPELAHFGAAINRSRAMLELEDDWDGEGSPGYTEETWRRAVEIAVESAHGFLELGEQPPPSPAISTGPDGSVDVLWRLGTKKLMINVPTGIDEPITCHGFDPDNPRSTTEGVVEPNKRNTWVLDWLTQ